MAAQIETLQRKSAEEPRGAALSSIEHEELRGISRTVAEIHWLLLILVLLYLVFGGVRDDGEAGAAVTSGLFFYAALVMSFRYANFYRRETRWKIALETWGMIAFVTWVLWFTDALASPLLNAFLLPVITSALTLGKLTTLVNVGLIAACYILLGGNAAPEERLSRRSSRRSCWWRTSPRCSRPTSATGCSAPSCSRRPTT
jgi:multisubunit Na+/H+ antiporter MnhB subunit